MNSPSVAPLHSTPQASVASGHPQVTETACAILRAGGNAFDAVVAAGFAAAVAEPALTSLGGGGFLLARTAQGQAVLFDFFVDTPGRGLPDAQRDPHFLPVTVRFPGCEQLFNIGLGSAATPGNLRGYLHVQRRLGRLPLRKVLAPAIALARSGVAVNTQQAYFFELLIPILTLTAAGQALFAPEGPVLGAGAVYRNPDLAAFLETLPRDGDREFYEGALAQRRRRHARGRRSADHRRSGRLPGDRTGTAGRGLSRLSAADQSAAILWRGAAGLIAAPAGDARRG